MDEPVFDNPVVGRILPLGTLTLDEVKKAERDGAPLCVTIAYVTRGKEAAFSFRLDHIRDVCVYDDGAFLFVGDGVQLITKVLARYELETTMRLEGHSSVCTVLVNGRSASMTFCTTITITDITDMFVTEE